MSSDREFTTLEIVSIAIKSEIEAAKLYKRMKEMTDDSTLKEKFDFLISQENKHERILTATYKKMFPDVELTTPPKSPFTPVEEVLSGDPSLKDLFEAAMEAERVAEGFYGELAKKTKNPNTKSLLLYLAKMEHSHLVLLEVEYEQIERGTDLDLDDFLTGERLMHLGP